jgi:hypothetical protein
MGDGPGSGPKTATSTWQRFVHSSTRGQGDNWDFIKNGGAGVLEFWGWSVSTGLDNLLPYTKTTGVPVPASVGSWVNGDTHVNGDATVVGDASIFGEFNVHHELKTAGGVIAAFNSTDEDPIALNIGILASATAEDQGIYLDACAPGVSDIRPLVFQRFGGKAGVRINKPVSPFHIYEDTSAYDETVGLTIENDGTGNAMLQFYLTDTQRWIMGIDHNYNECFSIARGGDFASGTVFSINLSDRVDIDGSHSYRVHTLEGTITDASMQGKSTIAMLCDSSDSQADIRGFADGVDGQVIRLFKTGSYYPMYIYNSDAAGTQKIHTPNGGTLAFPLHGGVTMIFYEGFWNVLSPN